MNKKDFLKKFDEAIGNSNVASVTVLAWSPGLTMPEFITNTRENLLVKREYYDKVYNDEMKLSSCPDVYITEVVLNYEGVKKLV